MKTATSPSAKTRLNKVSTQIFSKEANAGITLLVSLLNLRAKRYLLPFGLLLTMMLGSIQQSIGQGTTGSNQSYTFVAPAGVTQVTVEAWGGGGAGGGGTSGNTRGGGGGGGAYVKAIGVPVTPGNSYTITVGSGGTAGTGNGAAGNASIANKVQQLRQMAEVVWQQLVIRSYWWFASSGVGTQEHTMEVQGQLVLE